MLCIDLLSVYGDEDENEIQEIVVGAGEQLRASDERKSPEIFQPPTFRTRLTPPQSLGPADHAKSDATSYAGNRVESVETEGATVVSANQQKDIDPLDEFISSPPKGKCSEELQEKIIKFLALNKIAGRSFNSELRKKKEFRNPDFLLHAVTYQNIEQIGSCFSKDIFDPHGYDKSDFYDEIEAEMRRHMKSLAQARKKSQNIYLTSGELQSANVAPPKHNLPNRGPTARPVGASNVISTTLDDTARGGRPNKKSKWDQVDVDQTNPLDIGENQPSAGAHAAYVIGGRENLYPVGAPAALPCAAKAGSRHPGSTHQRTKKAREMRSWR